MDTNTTSSNTLDLQLLAALKRLVGEHADLGEIDLTDDERGALDQAREVIAKAEKSAAPRAKSLEKSATTALDAFVCELTDLVQRHKATISYTADDDGIHVSVADSNQSARLGFISEGKIDLSTSAHAEVDQALSSSKRR